MRCPATRALQVHHKTYERLGEERDADLEVLCETCHKGHHIQEENTLRRYVAIVSKCLAAERFTTTSDLLEAVKVACVTNKIAYDGPTISRAVHVVNASRYGGVVDAPRPRQHTPAPPMSAPIGSADAARILASLGFNPNLRTMPQGSGLTLQDVMRQRAMDQVGQLMLDSLKRCEELEQAVQEKP